MGRLIVSCVGLRVARDARRFGGGHAVAASCPMQSACTSSLVGRRDPLGVGPRPARLPVEPRSRARLADLRSPGWLLGGKDRYSNGMEPHLVRFRLVGR